MFGRIAPGHISALNLTGNCMPVNLPGSPSTLGRINRVTRIGGEVTAQFNALGRHRAEGVEGVVSDELIRVLGLFL